MLTDPISDMLIRIKNALMTGAETVTIPFSKQKKAILEILKKENCIENFEIEKTEKGFSLLQVKNLYLDNTPVITSIKRISKPGLRHYVKSKNIPRPKIGLKLLILSTPKGIMSGQEARKKGLGGEIICEVL